LTATTLAEHFQEARAVLRKREVGGIIARTACFNVGTAAAALSGVIVARTVGPTIRGEYAAVTSWFGIVLLLGEMGQAGAVCFYVARDQRQAAGYVATSRTLMIASGAVALAGGLLVAPLLAHGNPGLADAYYWCRRSGLAPGRVRLSLAGPLTRYGLAQLAAVTPTAVNNYPDQLVLSQLVPPADLGRYAIAASVTMVPVPLVWILTPGGIFLACGQVVGDLLRGLNRPGLVALAQGLAAIGTVTLLIVLLPSCGVAAAAIASTVAYGTALAAMLRWLRRPPRSAGEHPRRAGPPRHRRTRSA